MVDPSHILESSQHLLPAITTGITLGLAFVPKVRYELLKRDYWTCQNDSCVGHYIDQGALDWQNGWMLNAAHYPDMHQKKPDRDPSHGRCLCVHCHIIEEIDRGNHSGAGFLYEQQTIRNKDWLQDHQFLDQKPPITWYYDWTSTDELGREGLAQAYTEMFDVNS